MSDAATGHGLFLSSSSFLFLAGSGCWLNYIMHTYLQTTILIHTHIFLNTYVCNLVMCMLFGFIVYISCLSVCLCIFLLLDLLWLSKSCLEQATPLAPLTQKQTI